MYKPYTPKYRPSYRTNYSPPTIKPRRSINYYTQPQVAKKSSGINMDWLIKPSKFEEKHPLNPKMRMGIIIVLCILMILLIASIICFATIQENYLNTHRIYKSKKIEDEHQKR